MVTLHSKIGVVFLEHIHKGCYSVEVLCSNHFCKLMVPSRKNPRAIFYF